MALLRSVTASVTSVIALLGALEGLPRTETSQD